MRHVQPYVYRSGIRYNADYLLSMANVFVTHRIPRAGLDLLERAGHVVDVFEGPEAISRDEFLQRVRGVDAIIPLLTERVDAQVLDAAGPQLQIVANYAVGFDNIDLEAAAQRQVVVTNTPGVLTQTVAEHTIALMMALGRRLVEADQYVREGRYTGWDPELFTGMQFSRTCIGIIGAGRIGYTVAKIAHEGLGMRVVYYNRSKSAVFETEFQAKQESLNDLCAQADVISVHVPLTAETTHLIGPQQFQHMKKSALVINTARGPVIDERALIEALQTDRIAGAALDVFEHEPKISQELLASQRVVLTPHIGSATQKAREEMSLLAARNVELVLSGDEPSTPVV